MLFTWDLPLWIIGGLTVGMILGAMPGISGVIAITLLLAPSYHMPPLSAIIFLTAIYTGSVYGGGVTSILLKIPGTPAAVATSFDGYPMTQAGRHNEALGLSIMSSAVGCFLSYAVVLALFLPLGQIVLKFGPPEMLMVVLFAIASVGLVGGEVIPSLITGLFGILLGTIGASSMANARGTFGQDALFEGIPLIPALLGLLAVSQLFVMTEREYVTSDGELPQQSLFEIIKGMTASFRHLGTLIKSSFVGVGIGLMPAAGSTIASMVSYGLARRSSSNPDNFGHGEPEGVVAAESANNGSEGGAVATMMLLGIPGSATTALLLAAFMIHGMSPGPYLVRENLDFAYAVIISQFLQAAGLIIVAALFVNYFSRLIYLPIRILVPAVFVFSMVGALADRGLIIDVWVMLVFALIGLILKKLEYPIVGFILGFVLGGLVDREFMKSFLLFEDDLSGLFTRPAFVALLVLTLISLFWSKLKALFKRRKESSESSSAAV